MDTMSPDAKTEQCLHGGENIDAVSVDDGIIWKDTREKRLPKGFHLLPVKQDKKARDRNHWCTSTEHQ